MVEAALAVGGENGAEAFAFEQNPDRVAQAVVIVNDENGKHRHRDFSAMRGGLADGSGGRGGNLQLFYSAGTAGGDLPTPVNLNSGSQ